MRDFWLELSAQELNKKMPTKTLVKVTTDIQPGPTIEYQKKLWRIFWTHLIVTAQNELKARNEVKR